MYVGMHEGHPLSTRAGISIRDLERQPMILYPNTPLAGLAQEVVAAFRREKVQIEVMQERSEEHTSELQSPCNLVCRLLLEKKKKKRRKPITRKNAVQEQLPPTNNSRTTATPLRGVARHRRLSEHERSDSRTRHKQSSSWTS